MGYIFAKYILSKPADCVKSSLSQENGESQHPPAHRQSTQGLFSVCNSTLIGPCKLLIMTSNILLPIAKHIRAIHLSVGN